jgi:hypothetical protein
VVRAESSEQNNFQEKPGAPEGALQDQFLQHIKEQGRPKEKKTDKHRPEESGTADKNGLAALEKSINGVPRFLDKIDTGTIDDNKHAGLKRKNAPNPTNQPTNQPDDLAQVVPAKDLEQYRRAFELIGKFEQQTQKEVYLPTYKELAAGLNAAEKAMPKSKLDELERERLLYGMALDNISNNQIPDGDIAMRGLAYYPDPPRGKAMKEFDEQVADLARTAAEHARQRAEKVSIRFGPELGQAYSMQERYARLKEAKEAPVIEI